MTDTIAYILFAVWLIAWMFTFFMLFRNMYTHKMQRRGLDIISEYCQNLILKNEYSLGKDYFCMMETYDTYLWRLWDWSLKGTIKKEYRELLLGHS